MLLPWLMSPPVEKHLVNHGLSRTSSLPAAASFSTGISCPQQFLEQDQCKVELVIACSSKRSSVDQRTSKFVRTETKYSRIAQKVCQWLNLMVIIICKRYLIQTKARTNAQGITVEEAGVLGVRTNSLAPGVSAASCK